MPYDYMTNYGGIYNRLSKEAQEECDQNIFLGENENGEIGVYDDYTNQEEIGLSREQVRDAIRRVKSY